jgi:hypothetical protein
MKFTSKRFATAGIDVVNKGRCDAAFVLIEVPAIRTVSDYNSASKVTHLSGARFSALLH